MPSTTPTVLRASLAQRTLDPIYLIVGDDETEMQRLASEIATVVEDELRAFNVERLYGGDKGVTAASIVESCRLLPMMSDRRVVIVLRGERLLKPKRRGRAAEQADNEEAAEPPSDLDLLDEYLKRPEPSTTLVIVASDVDRTRRIGKTLYKSATLVECWGLKPGRDARFIDFRQIGRVADQLVRKAVSEAGQHIDPAASRLVAERAGTDIGRLRGDIERLLLFASGQARITLADVQEVVSAETAQDDWAVTNAIQRRNAPEALRQIGLALEGGAVPYMILGQLAWFVRERLEDSRRIPAAIEALFRTDLDLKTSGGDPRILLERLVVELCGSVGKA
jgi:DNA polymerase-3 subunit delta